MQANIPYQSRGGRGRAWRNNRRFINITLAVVTIFLVIMTYVNISYMRSLSANPAASQRGNIPREVEKVVGKEEAYQATAKPTTPQPTAPQPSTRVKDEQPAAENAEPQEVKKHLPPATKGGFVKKQEVQKEEEGKGALYYVDDANPEKSTKPEEKGVRNPIRVAETKAASADTEDPADKEDAEEQNAVPKDSNSDKKTLQFNKMTFEEALGQYYQNLHATLKANENPKQNTKSFVDVNEVEDDGILLPHDPSQVPDPKTYLACDNRDAEFTPERDALCQSYMSDINNMQSIKALGSLLYSGRTIKFKVFYRHGGLQAVVKVSQQKFFFEAASEYLAYSVDRGLNLSYVPPTSFVNLPVDYMRAASASVSPFFSQWFEGFVPEYKYTQSNLVQCPSGTPYQAFLDKSVSQPNFRAPKAVIKDYETRCSQVAVQLWMKDVHSALDTFLAVPHEYSDRFAKKYMRPYRMKNETFSKRSKYPWPPEKPHRLQAIGDLCDRMIFDFLIGNTDRGMNDHNNFVYGGCNEDTECKQPAPENRLKTRAKYAFIDHGSSFYSHKEPEGNPFTGNSTLICRFRRSTYDKLWYFHRENERGYISKFPDEPRPFIHYARGTLPKGIFNVIHMSVFKKVQDRLQKIVDIIDDCVDVFGENEVFSL